MKKNIIFLLIIFLVTLGSCYTNKTVSSNETDIDDTTIETPPAPAVVETPPTTTPKPLAPPQIIDTSTLNSGVGPVSFLSLDDPIDEAMAEKGKTIYKNHCTACHKLHKDYIGPKIYGVIEKRNPAWIMNMILNADEMLRVDKDAIALLEKYRAPMPFFSGSIDDARAIVEYMRTITVEE